VKERITLKNFVVIKKADIELKRLNIIIGPQANGKSLIAKLVCFFRNIPEAFISSIRKLDTKREFDKIILCDFEERFPRYSWEGTSFTIHYFNGEFSFEIEGKRTNKGKTTLTIKYCEILAKIFNSKKALFKRKTEERRSASPEDRRYSDYSILLENISNPLKEEYGYFFGKTVFIPASRSFFANLQNNIFSFLASSLKIDPFLKDFGQLYEHSKGIHNDKYIARRYKDIHEQFSPSLEAIISGSYEYQDDQDWIVSKGRKINLINASSGQQESLPMLLVLSIWPAVRSEQTNSSMYFIEEPEAHLFPTSQSRIVSLLSQILTLNNTNLFITSHSPYILSAFNNLILAHDKIAEESITLAEFQKINGTCFPISFEDVSAYTISEGVTESIADSDYRMIGGDILDSVSEHFEKVMNALLTCEGKK
jgi:AAA15 family ATPase/GTPase